MSYPIRQAQRVVAYIAEYGNSIIINETTPIQLGQPQLNFLSSKQKNQLGTISPVRLGAFACRDLPIVFG